MQAGARFLRFPKDNKSTENRCKIRTKKQQAKIAKNVDLGKDLGRVLGRVGKVGRV